MFFFPLKVMSCQNPRSFQTKETSLEAQGQHPLPWPKLTMLTRYEDGNKATHTTQPIKTVLKYKSQNITIYKILAFRFLAKIFENSMFFYKYVCPFSYSFSRRVDLNCRWRAECRIFSFRIVKSLSSYWSFAVFTNYG